MTPRIPQSGLLACLFLLGTAVLPAQVPVFWEQLGLLDNSDLDNPPFTTSTPIAVVDLNGDRRDDIVRIDNDGNDMEEVRFEFQTTPGAAFGHLEPVPDIFDQPGTDRPWKYAAAVCVADVDRNGINDVLIGAYDFNFTGGGLELLLGNSSGTAWPGDRPYVKDGALLVQGTIFTDIDNDGHIDIISCDDRDDLEKFMNDGFGNFSPAAPGVLDTFISGPNPGSSFPPNQGNYAIIATDCDHDGDVDYYVSKCRLGDSSTTSLARINRLFVNDGSQNYTELPGGAGLADPDQSWSADFADIDNDGDLDCFVMNHQSSSSGGSSMFLNDGTGNFADSTAAVGLAGAVNFKGNQAVCRDFNNDGFIDLLVADQDQSGVGYGYYQNDGDGTFTSYYPPNGIFKTAGGASNLNRIHSFAVGDLNHDGHLDLYIGRGRGINADTTEPDVLVFNQGNGNRHLTVTLVGGPTCNPNGIGARLEAHGPWGVGGGTGVQVREVRSGEGYGIMNSLNTHFGLGSATQVDQLVVKWPNGTVDTINNVPGDRFVTVYEGTNAVAMDFANWIADFYPGGGGDAASDADPDGDGTGNAAEQLLGWDPSVADAGSAAEASIVNDAGQDYLLVEVDRVPAQNLVPGMQFSTDVVGWYTDPAMEVLEDTPLRYAIRLPVDLSTQPRLFVRLTVEVGS